MYILRNQYYEIRILLWQCSCSCCQQGVDKKNKQEVGPKPNLWERSWQLLAEQVFGTTPTAAALVVMLPHILHFTQLIPKLNHSQSTWSPLCQVEEWRSKACRREWMMWRYTTSGYDWFGCAWKIFPFLNVLSLAWRGKITSCFHLAMSRLIGHRRTDLLHCATTIHR